MVATKYRLPFEVPPTKHEQISISPVIAGVMLEGTPEERRTIELIAENWTKRADEAIKKGLPEPEFGLQIPRRFGFTATERAALEGASSLERQKAIEGFELVKRISEEKGRSIADIQEQVMKLGQGVPDISGLEDYLGQIFDINNRTTDIDLVSATLFVRRTIHEWQDWHTIALHPAIREQLSSLWYLENNRSDGIDEGKESALSES